MLGMGIDKEYDGDYQENKEGDQGNDEVEIEGEELQALLWYASPAGNREIF